VRHTTSPASAVIAIALFGWASNCSMPVAASGKPKDTVVPACVSDDLRERMRGRFPQEKSDQGDDYYLDVVKAMICIVKMSDLSVKSENQFQLDLRSATESGRPRRRPGGESGPLKVALRKDTGMVGITGSVRILGAFKGICTGNTSSRPPLTATVDCLSASMTRMVR
jgi:hypothetical protein